ncbi:unnamed protein product [Paramecium sonneborni]|uniref:Uncharacterized protein n=1 Tax=Paramecium sonneborni TaxID=65129 RepID=A0A8S1RCC5_9CILI|nr:unnamed protein product [Paramecium sonneborni]
MADVYHEVERIQIIQSHNTQIAYYEKYYVNYSQEQYETASSPTVIKFLCKVLGILALILTFIYSFILISFAWRQFRNLFFDHENKETKVLYYIFLFTSFIIGIICYCSKSIRIKPFNYIVFIGFTISISIVIGMPIGYALSIEENEAVDETKVYACVGMLSFFTYASIFAFYLNVKKQRDELAFGNSYLIISIAQIVVAGILFLVAHEEYSTVIWVILIIMNFQFIILILELISIMNGKHQLNTKDYWIAALLLLIGITILSFILCLLLLFYILSILCSNEG